MRPSIRLPKYTVVSPDPNATISYEVDDKPKRKRINWRRILPLVLLPLFVYIAFIRRADRARIPFHYALPAPTTNTTFSPTARQQIPPYVHFVFGLSPTFGGKPFGFLQYLCLSSALEKLHPEVLFLHHVYPPTGWWWDQFVNRVEAKRGATELRMVKQRDVREIFGNEVEHFAHKADVIRLEALRDYGGVYLDTDVLVIKDMAPLYQYETVLGMESQPNLDPALPPSGLCNAVILSKPFSSFITRWLESYRTFNKEVWAQHSVTMPWTIAHAFPHDVTVLNKFAFFWPLWHDDHLRVVHRGTGYRFDRPDPLAPTYDTQFTYHLWESLAWERYLSPYDPDRIHNRGMKTGAEREEDGASDESSFSREARQYVSQQLREDWRQAVKDGKVSKYN